MLSVFPELLFLSPFAALLIRLTAGFILGRIALKHLGVPVTGTRALGVIEGVVAILLIVGAYTQIAAIVGFIALLFTLFLPAYRTLPRSTIILLAIMCFSLLVTGPGPFAFDLPL